MLSRRLGRRRPLVAHDAGLFFGGCEVAREETLGRGMWAGRWMVLLSGISWLAFLSLVYAR